MIKHRHSRSVRMGIATAVAMLAVLAAGLLPVAAAAPAASKPASSRGAAAPVAQAAAANDAAAIPAAAAVDPRTVPAGTDPQVVLGTPIITGLDHPVLFVPRGNTGYIVEQTGIILRATYDSGTQTWTKQGKFLDIRSLVTDPNGDDASEQGLLGLAFPPNFDAKGKFYVYFTAKSDGRDTLAMFRLKSATKADPTTERPVLQIPDPYPNHNGGNLQFVGNDLYIGIGDGGSGGDPGNRAQNLNIRLGKILRIDPRDPDGPGPLRYSIPADNPFVGVTHAKPEVWAYGLRNPWRWSIDPSTGDMWIGDVGQCQYEEVDHSGNAKGLNFGWRLYEGTHVYNRSDCTADEPECSSNCDTLPVAEYDHASSGSCAITGGWVYHGSAYPAWDNEYLYGDYCSGKMWIISAVGSPGTPIDVSPSTGINISSFARDSSGELYAIDLGGSIYKLQLTGTP